MPFHASVGPVLTRYEVDVAAATLTPREAVEMPANVQYAWPGPGNRFLYVATSDGGPGRRGTTHHLGAWAIAPGTGALSPHGTPAPLPGRPVHMALDRDGRHALVAYNDPSGLTVHRIEADGTVGAEVRQVAAPDVGSYAHQVLVAPSNATAILVTRGNDATRDRPEDPGALKVFDYRDGALALRASVAPGGGYGFGPRHLDFHPSQPWVYVSIERQNQLQMYRLQDGALDAAPRFTVSALRGEPGPRQLVGAIHVHPNGRFVYVSNRADGWVEHGGRKVFAGGENGIAVFEIDPATGEPTRIQNADTPGYHPRTFAIDPSGRLLIAAHIRGLDVRDGDGVRHVPASLDLFRIGGDGRLTLAGTHAVDTARGMQFWSGWIEAPRAERP